MDLERFDYLMNGYFDGELSSAECEELGALVISDSAARAAYWQFAQAHADLRSWGEQQAGQWQVNAAFQQAGCRPAARRSLRSIFSRYLRSWALSTVAATLLCACTFAGVHFLSGPNNKAVLPSSIAAGNRHLPRQNGWTLPTALPAVARLVRSYECDWSEQGGHVADGARLKVGQRLQLRSGLAELQFDCGARVILQGPASLQLDSTRTASLSKGKVTVRAETVAARGFAILTPSMRTVDLGTEFGLEVAPTGVEQVHVFRGEVVVSPSLANGPSVAPQHLIETQGIEVNATTLGVKLVANNGERFARSLDDAQKNRHVVAYWRFEDRPVGVLVPDSKEGQAPVRGSLDSSLNGNDLYTWNTRTQPRFSADAPGRSVPQSGEANTASLDNSTPPDGAGSRDLFTMSYWSRPSLTDVQTITPAKWTIEASIKVAKLRDGFQTFLVRDGINVCQADRAIPPLAFQITPQRHVKLLFCDVQQRSYEAIAEEVTIAENHWYHVAAASDGANLRLYVDSLDGKGYVLWAVTALADTGSTALARGNYPTDDPLFSPAGAGYPNIWSVGRGYYNGCVAEWFQGSIDEVRICDVALQPAEFLFSPRADKSGNTSQTANGKETRVDTRTGSRPDSQRADYQNEGNRST